MSTMFDPELEEQLEERRLSSEMEFLKEFLAGLMAGTCSKFVEYPCDTIKVRLQTADTGKYKGPIDCLQKLLKYEGFFRLYKGISSPLVGAMIESSVAMSTYAYLKRTLHKDPEAIPIHQLFLAGGAVGVLLALSNTPLDLIKSRLQLQSSLYSGPIDVIQKVIKKDGIKGFFRGFTVTGLKEGIGCACWFGSYEIVKKLATPYEKSPYYSLTPLVGGAFSGLMYWIFPYPIDSIKSIIQTSSEKRTIRSVFLEVLHTKGISGLYKGLSVTLMRAVPTNAVLWFAYSHFSKFIDDHLNENYF